MISYFLKYRRCGSSAMAPKALVALAVITGLFAASPSLLAGADPQEFQVKAAFISNIAKYVRWPAGTFSDPAEPFALYIMGEDRFGEAFVPFVEEMIHERPLVVHKILVWEDIPADCRVLYVGVSDKKELKRVLEKVAGKAILTISDEPFFTEMGGILGLYTINDKVQFAFNLSSAKENGLIISSNLIKLAVAIKGDAR